MELIGILLGILLVTIGIFFILAKPFKEIYHKFLCSIKRNRERKCATPEESLLPRPKKVTERREKIKAATPHH